MRKKLLINSLSGGIQLLIGTVLVLIAVPIFIHKLGIEYYGVFSILMVVNNFSVFLGLGINSSLIKFLSEQGKSRASDIDIIVAYTFIAAILLPFTALCLYYDDFVIRNILNVPVSYINENTRWLFGCLILSNLFQFIGQVPASILDSLQRIYLTNFFQTLYQFIYWSLIIISIYFFGSIKMIGVSILVCTLVWLCLLFISSIKYWGAVELKFNKTEFNNSLKKQISYSYKLYLSQVINFFYEPLTKILLSSYVGISAVGYFDIILRVRTQIWNIMTKLLYPLSPFISQLKNNITIRNLIHDVEQKLVYIIFFLISVVIFVIPDFVHLWLKSDITILSTGMVLVISANLVAIIVLPLYQFLALKGYPEKTIVLQALNVLVNLIVFFLFYKDLGFMSVVWGNVCAILSSFSLCLYYQKKYLDSLIFDSFIHFLKSLLLFLFIFFSGFFVNIFIAAKITKILFLPVILLLLTVFFIRILKLITRKDILRYAGKNQKIEILLTRVFIITPENTTC